MFGNRESGESDLLLIAVVAAVLGIMWMFIMAPSVTEARAFTDAAGALAHYCDHASCSKYSADQDGLKRAIAQTAKLDRNASWYRRFGASYQGSQTPHVATLVDAGASEWTCSRIVDLGGKDLAMGTLSINGSVYDYERPGPKHCGASKGDTISFSVAVK